MILHNDFLHRWDPRSQRDAILLLSLLYCDLGSLILNERVTVIQLLRFERVWPIRQAPRKPFHQCIGGYIS